MNHLSEEQLNEYLDHESQEREQIEMHLSNCDECAARFDSLQLLFHELESLPEQILSRNLAAAVTRRVGWSGVLPRWLTLTIAIQAALAVITAVLAAPFMIEFASTSIPAMQTPNFTEILIQIQTQWTMWLSRISTFQLPAIPSIPVMGMSSLIILPTLAAVSMIWLIGNGLLLRNQIK